MAMNKKKAFTLTELLVVVIVIGVLAAVVLPKYSKVMETRKTTEAEELMAAVRTEQEKRCALDKNYLADLSKFSDILPSADTKNFVYSSNKQGTGIEAQSKGKYNYTLKMPSYADGRLCCENEEQCAKLNKSYPLCSDLIARADYQSGAECAGVQCVGPQPEASQSCNGCGTQTREVTCDAASGTWKTGSWGECNKTPEECGGKKCWSWLCDESQGWKMKDNWYGSLYFESELECCVRMEECPKTCPAGTEKIRDYKRTPEDVCCGTPCPDTCDGGKVRTSVKYKELGECCRNSCKSLCGEYARVGMRCTAYNEQLGAGTTKRYVWELGRQEFYDDGDEGNCLVCPIRQYPGAFSTYPDLRDVNGKVLVQGKNAQECWTQDECPEGYIKEGPVCYKEYKFKPVAKKCNGIFSLDGGHIGSVSAQFQCFDGGSFVNQKCPVWRGGKKVAFGTACTAAYGSPEKMCQSCDPKKEKCSLVCSDAQSYEKLMENYRELNNETTYSGKFPGMASANASGCCDGGRSGVQDGDYWLWQSFLSGCKKAKTVRQQSVTYYECVPM